VRTGGAEVWVMSIPEEEGMKRTRPRSRSSSTSA